MTREEAIYRLKNAAWLGTDEDREATEQAVNMAVDALSNNITESPNEAIKRQNDAIERQATIDAVKKNTFRLTFAEEQNCEGHVAWSVDGVYSGELLELPSAEAVQVVRCKDCKHRYISGNGTTRFYLCDFMDAQYEDNGFCNHGERKGGEEE